MKVQGQAQLLGEPVFAADDRRVGMSVGVIALARAEAASAATRRPQRPVAGVGS